MGFARAQPMLNPFRSGTFFVTRQWCLSDVGIAYSDPSNEQVKRHRADLRLEFDSSSARKNIGLTLRAIGGPYVSLG
jgi:hypothetical protein